tara:strand:+ start:22332 stop:25817 length:3486 start_codon:yes stop_codon:yes gene_type:complete
MKSSSRDKKWQFSIDRGGTFTDVIGIDPEDKIHTLKLLSESPDYPDPAIEGIQRILGVSKDETIPEEKVSGIRMGTTVATNAFLERKGTSTALFITRGFRDLLEIGHQARPEIFNLKIQKPRQLYRCVKEVEERINAAGKVIRHLNVKKVEADLMRIRRMGISSVAIVLMHAWENPDHERIVATLARKTGFRQVSVSHEVMPMIKIVGRGQTTVVDAYLTPVLMAYINSVRKFSGNIRLEFMQSSGGITEAHAFTGKDAIMSGPAGGGSLLWFDGQKFRVGPESAGSQPGPACYGRGGPLALTDANLLLGRIIPDYFPSTFGAKGDKPLNKKIVKKMFDGLTETINKSQKNKMTATEAALGFVRIANETMAKAIKEISVSSGYDVRTHALVCFGGAAPQHTCALARILGIREIIIHPLAGLLSAYGIAMADYLRIATRSIVKKLDRKLVKSLHKQFEDMAKPLVSDLVDRGTKKKDISVRRYFDIRPLGSDTFLSIPAVNYGEIHENFYRTYRRHFGFEPIGVPLELVNIRVEVAGKSSTIKEKRAKSAEPVTSYRLPVTNHQLPVTSAKVYFTKEGTKTPVYLRSDLQHGEEVTGPAIVVEDFTTIVIEPGFIATVNEYGHIVLKQKEVIQEKVSVHRHPVMLEVFNHLFMSVAEQMGHTLQNTAHSVNIKERLDFSCAIFDREGNLIANAPHIPVHLGAMGESVKSIIQDNHGKMKSGDVYVMNNPHRGGSHLPDVTVVAPVFGEKESPIFYTAARGHHADIGGITPGSMPPFAKSLEEEGIVIDNFLLVRNGKFREKEIRTLLQSGIFPARNMNERISDLKAQIAAMKTGIHELHLLVDKYSLKSVHAYMTYIRENAAEAMRQALLLYLGEKQKVKTAFEDFLDDGSKIAVSMKIEKGNRPSETCRVVVDFSGTSPELVGNLNAPVAVTKAAVLYVFRTLIDADIPLNSGCLDPVEIRIPEGSLLNPSPEAAVVGGNVETSQRVVDVLLGALGIAAASQGTMNNFLFGRADGKGKQYYETIAGGSGAIDGYSGASAVQVHMTNTRATDPEVLEQRFPEIRLERFTIRHGSGGKGKFRGGDGTIREMKFLKPRKISILSERRNYPPYGIVGGSIGAKGKNQLRKKNGRIVNLDGKVEMVIDEGETIIIKTPGGGGCGRQ